MKKLSSVGSLLKTTTQIYRQKYFQFIEVLLLALVGAFPLLIVYEIYYFVNYNNSLGQYSTVNFFLSLLYFAATLVAAYFALSSIIGCYLVAKDERHASPWLKILATRKYFWKFLLVWLMFEAVVLICGLPLFVSVRLVSGSWFTLLLSSHVGVSFWIGVWLAIFLLPILWAAVTYFWSFFALMEDGWRNISALARSRELVKKRFWLVTARLAAFFGIWLAFYLLVSLHLFWPSDNIYYTIWAIIMKLVLIFSNFIFVPSLIIFGRLLYKELADGNSKTKLKPAGSKLFVKVVVVIGALFLLLSLVNTVYNFNSGAVFAKKMEARNKQRISDIKSIQSGLAAYYQEQGKYPDWLVMGQPLAAGSKIYIQKLPSNVKSEDGACPVDFEYTYASVVGGKDYTLSYCLGSSLSPDINDPLLSAGEHKVGKDDMLF